MFIFNRHKLYGSQCFIFLKNIMVYFFQTKFESKNDYNEIDFKVAQP